MQESLAHLDNRSRYNSVQGINDEKAPQATLPSAAAATGLEVQTRRLRLGDASNGLDLNDDFTSVSDTASAVMTGHSERNGKAPIRASKTNGDSAAQSAEGAIVEDQEFDGMLDELNKDLPPHACR